MEKQQAQLGGKTSESFVENIKFYSIVNVINLTRRTRGNQVCLYAELEHPGITGDNATLRKPRTNFT